MNGITVVAVGDVSLNGDSRVSKYHAAVPWAGLYQEFAGADIVLANFESPITKAPQISDNKLCLRASKDAIQIIQDSGFHVLNLANNHAMDFGPEGLEDTIAALDQIGMPHVGAGSSLESASSGHVKRVNGQLVAFISFCDVVQISPLYATATSAGVMPLDDTSFERVAVLASQCDWVIVQLHWGEEMCRLPSPDQRQVARRFVEAGADAIIGHHPHVLQPMEVIDGTPVWYSLGNFVFSGQFWRGVNEAGEHFVGEYRLHPLARETGIAKIRLRKNAEPICEFVPAKLMKDGTVIQDERCDRLDDWNQLCSWLDDPAYLDRFTEELNSIGPRSELQYESRSIYHRIRLKAFQFGLLR